MNNPIFVQMCGFLEFQKGGHVSESKVSPRFDTTS